MKTGLVILALGFCFLGSNACLARVDNDRLVTGDSSKPGLLRNGVYSGKIRTDSVFYHHQLAFVNRDTALFFLNERASSLVEIPCATFYRVAPLNQYYQVDGSVTDYYLENDSVAARLSYSESVLNGPCVFYYKNGQIREKGDYSKNERTGVWDYYFENGQKAKTIRYTGSGALLIDCYNEAGEVLAKNGNGRFEGEIFIGPAAGTADYKASGPVKDGLPDGKWLLFNRFLSYAANVEQFSNGEFIHGKSNSLHGGTQEYKQNPVSTFDGVHPVEILSYYALNNWCTVAGRKQQSSGGKDGYQDPYADLDNELRNILSSSSTSYSGWVILDIQYGASDQVIRKSVRLYQENEAFRKQLLDMLDRLPHPGAFILDGKTMPVERFYVVLVDKGQFVIPEEVLARQRKEQLLGK